MNTTAYPKIGSKTRGYRVTAGTAVRIVSDQDDALKMIQTAMSNGAVVSLDHGMIYTRSDSARIFFTD